MKIIFLDVDGVLNDHTWNEVAQSGTIMRRCVKQLNRIIHEHPDCRFVISSAWRYLMLETGSHVPAMSFAGFEMMMRTHGVSAGFKVIGMTCSDEAAAWNPKTNKPVRGKQIKRWIKEQSPKDVYRYLAIDDMDLGITAAKIPFVQTDGKRGLTKQDADLVIWELV